jgi:hypothetical protein
MDLLTNRKANRMANREQGMRGDAPFKIEGQAISPLPASATLDPLFALEKPVKR